MNIYFLSGLPRSGSTLLAAILNQNHATKVSTTSGLVHALDGLANTWHSTDLLNAQDPDRTLLAAAMRQLIVAFHPEIDKTIIDKSRGWPIPLIMSAMTQVLGRPPKIIATVRPIPDCAASFVRIAKPDNLDEFMQSDHLMTHLRAAYLSLQAGYQANPDIFLIIDYDDLVTNPAQQLKRIHDFLDLPEFAYDFDNIDGSSVAEDDEQLHGYKGMHKVAGKVARQHNQTAQEVLGHYYDRFCQPEFWNPDKLAMPRIDLLDEAVKTVLTGDFIAAESFVDMALQLNPNDNRALFNKGWYELSRGNLKTGMQLLACGRNENVFGNPSPSSMPIWTGQDLTGKTVLLNLEGGLGDQICNARFATNLSKLGAKVILAGSAELATTLLQIEGVTAFIDGSVAGGVYHDYWMPSMSAALLLGLEYVDLNGSAYIPCKPKSRGDKLRVGLRWSGNPQFEHEQHRRFDPALMFALTAMKDIKFINLQRDSDVPIPASLEQPDLSTWDATRRAIESCDLVISSCTSVAHLSAAMGKPTWVIVPVLPYYLWAMPGDKSDWYNAVRLFRKTEKDNWQRVFTDIYDRLLIIKESK